MFDRLAWIKLPRNMLRGHGVLGDFSAAVDELYLSGDSFLVMSPSPDHIAGDQVCDQLDDVTSVPLDRVSFESVERIVDAARGVGAGYLIALGNGKLIDVTRMVSGRLDCGLISVPTAASHDGIVSGRSSIPEGDIHYSVVADPPFVVVADTELLAEAPWGLTIAGYTDIISSYTAIKDWELARRLKNVEYSEYAGTLSQVTAKMLAGSVDSIKPGLEESARIATEAPVSSDVAMPIAGSSWSASGTEHLFSHQPGHIAPGSALYSHQVGVGSIMTEYFHSGTRGKWTDTRDTLLMMGAPTTANELGIDDEAITEAFTTVHEIRDRYTILGNGVNEEAAIEAATVTGAIQAHLFMPRVAERPLVEESEGKKP